MRLRSWTRRRRRLAWSLRCRGRRSHFLLRIVFAGRFRILFSPSFGNHSLLHRRLVLHKFNIRNLRSWRRRNQEEEGKDEARDDKREVEYIGAARSLRQFDYIFRIYLLALNDSSSVVSISCRICKIGKEETHDHHRSRRSEMSLGERSYQFPVRLHMKGLTE